MSSFLFRRATCWDLNLITKLCIHSCNVKEEGLGYPRIEQSAELIAELELYNNTLENCLYMIMTEDGEPIGTTGFLFEPGSSCAYLIGPILEGSWRTPEAMRDALPGCKWEDENPYLLRRGGGLTRKKFSQLCFRFHCVANELLMLEGWLNF